MASFAFSLSAISSWNSARIADSRRSAALRSPSASRSCLCLSASARWTTSSREEALSRCSLREARSSLSSLLSPEMHSRAAASSALASVSFARSPFSAPAVSSEDRLAALSSSVRLATCACRGCTCSARASALLSLPCSRSSSRRASSSALCTSSERSPAARNRSSAAASPSAFCLSAPATVSASVRRRRAAPSSALAASSLRRSASFSLSAEASASCAEGLISAAAPPRAGPCLRRSASVAWTSSRTPPTA
mmetsp:Transcript_29537/g.70363  ORF Transcript_29537/g.70363 Transcript_29537/m.70363 type:complete len:252 (-) Transcript_29537:659-1414(-)